MLLKRTLSGDQAEESCLGAGGGLQHDATDTLVHRNSEENPPDRKPPKKPAEDTMPSCTALRSRYATLHMRQPRAVAAQQAATARESGRLPPTPRRIC